MIRLYLIVLLGLIAMPSGCLSVLTAKSAVNYVTMKGKRAETAGGATIGCGVLLALVVWRFIATVRGMRRLAPGTVFLGFTRDTWLIMLWSAVALGIVVGFRMLDDLKM